MKWELDALKILAKNPTVPGVALQDAVSEIAKLRAENARYTEALKAISIGMIFPKEFAANALDLKKKLIPDA